MHSDSNSTETPDGLGLMVKVDAARPLAELTVLVNLACDRAEGRPEKGAVILELGATPVDRCEWPGDVNILAVTRWERAVRRLERLDALNIAVAHGNCGGPALELLLAADFRIGAPDLQLTMPVNDGHVWPGMLLYRLVQHLGLARARQVFMRGTGIPLRQATDLGLVDEVCGDVPAAVRAGTALLERVSGREAAVRRQLLLEAATTEYDEALGAHLAACDRELRRLCVGRKAAAPELTGEATA